MPRAIFDYTRAVEPASQRGDWKDFLHRIKGKLPKLRRAAELFAAEHRRVSDHTNFQMAAASLTGCVRQIEEILARETSPKRERGIEDKVPRSRFGLARSRPPMVRRKPVIRGPGGTANMTRSMGQEGGVGRPGQAGRWERLAWVLWLLLIVAAVGRRPYITCPPTRLLFGLRRRRSASAARRRPLRRPRPQQPVRLPLQPAHRRRPDAVGIHAGPGRQRPAARRQPSRVSTRLLVVDADGPAPGANTGSPPGCSAPAWPALPSWTCNQPRHHRLYPYCAGGRGRIALEHGGPGGQYGLLSQGLPGGPWPWSWPSFTAAFALRWAAATALCLLLPFCSSARLVGDDTSIGCGGG